MDKTAFASIPHDPELEAEVEEVLTSYMDLLEAEWDDMVAAECADLYASPSAEEPVR